MQSFPESSQANQNDCKMSPLVLVVRLEPLQQPVRRRVQEQLCNKLNALSAFTPLGKILQLEVGQSPIMKR